MKLFHKQFHILKQLIKYGVCRNVNGVCDGSINEYMYHVLTIMDRYNHYHGI